MLKTSQAGTLCSRRRRQYWERTCPRDTVACHSHLPDSKNQQGRMFLLQMKIQLGSRSLRAHCMPAYHRVHPDSGSPQDTVNLWERLSQTGNSCQMTPCTACSCSMKRRRKTTQQSMKCKLRPSRLQSLPSTCLLRTLCRRLKLRYIHTHYHTQLCAKFYISAYHDDVCMYVSTFQSRSLS